MKNFFIVFHSKEHNLESGMRITDAKRMVRLAEWRNLIVQRANSGQSIRVWCEENGFTEQQYYYWLRCIRNEALSEHGDIEPCRLVKVDFAQATVPVSSQPESKPIIIRHGTATVELPGNTASNYIVSILKGLAQ